MMKRSWGGGDGGKGRSKAAARSNSSSNSDNRGSGESPGAGQDHPSTATRLIRRLSKWGQPAEDIKGNDEQTEVASKEGTLPWCIAHKHDAEALKMVRATPSLLNTRGPVGELPVLFAFLLGRFELAFDMIKLDPKLIEAIYDSEDKNHPSPYQGENLLHIAIVNKAPLDVIRKLLTTKGGELLLNGCTTGSFFALTDPRTTNDSGELLGQCYLGGYPLAFAIATNQFRTFEYLVEMGADLNMEDQYGNNCLHVLVLLQNTRAYAKFKATWKTAHDFDDEGRCKTNQDLVVPWKRRNKKEKLTPFTLAADRGLKEMFDFLLEEERQTSWVYGKVTCSVYPLDNGLDNIGDKSEHKSAMELIIKNGHVDLFENKRVHDLFERKWAHFGQRKIFYRFVWTLSYLLALGAFAFVRKIAPAAAAGLHVVLAHNALLAIVLLGALYVGLVEVKKMLITEGLRVYWLDQPAVSMSKSIASLLFAGCIGAFAYSRANGWERWEQMWLGLACPLAYSSLFFYLLAWRWAGPLVMTIGSIIKGDLIRFVAVWSIFISGFSLSFFVLDNSRKTALDLLENALRLFEVTLGEFSLEDVRKEGQENDNKIAAALELLLTCFFVAIVTILLLNTLIAMMSRTFENIDSSSEHRWRMERARIISECEASMSSQEWKDTGLKYFIIINSKRWLQVYDVNEKAFDSDELDADGLHDAQPDDAKKTD